MVAEKQIDEINERISMLEERIKFLEESLVIAGKMKPARNTAKYIGLTRYLRQEKRPRITLSFKEIESIVGFKLPESAYIHQPFWANTSSHSVAYSWMQVGYMARSLDLENQKITFVLEKE